MSALADTLTTIKKLSPEAEVIVGIIQAIQTATGLGGPSATAFLAAMQAALHELESMNGSVAVTAAQILADMVKAQADLAAQFAADDAAIDAKFPA